MRVVSFESGAVLRGPIIPFSFFVVRGGGLQELLFRWRENCLFG